MNRKSICLSLEEKDIALFDNVVDLLTVVNGYRFTRTSALLYLIRFFLNTVNISETKGDLAENLKASLSFDYHAARPTL